MKQLAFIWDMDGTLVDSYPAIVPAAGETLALFGVDLEPEAIHREVIASSVGALLERIARERGLDAAAVKADFALRNDSRIGDIRPMPHARDCLEALRQTGHQSFVYTHRGASCEAILRKNGLEDYFTEIVTALSGFPRKPEPDAILYLMEKYGLERDACFYVGDRSLDIEAAERAGIGSILLLDPQSPGKATGRETYLVRNLGEIPVIVESEE